MSSGKHEETQRETATSPRGDPPAPAGHSDCPRLPLSPERRRGQRPVRVALCARSSGAAPVSGSRLSRRIRSASARLARSCGDGLDDVDHRQDEERSPDQRTYLIFRERGTVCDGLGDSVGDLLPPALQPRLPKCSHRSHVRSSFRRQCPSCFPAPSTPRSARWSRSQVRPCAKHGPFGRRFGFARLATASSAACEGPVSGQFRADERLTSMFRIRL